MTSRKIHIDIDGCKFMDRITKVFNRVPNSLITVPHIGNQFNFSQSTCALLEPKLPHSFIPPDIWKTTIYRACWFFSRKLSVDWQRIDICITLKDLFTNAQILGNFYVQELKPKTFLPTSHVPWRQIRSDLYKRIEAWRAKPFPSEEKIINVNDSKLFFSIHLDVNFQQLHVHDFRNILGFCLHFTL